MRILMSGIFIVACAACFYGQTTSIYTSLAEKSCRDRKSMHKENIIYDAMCPGVGGMRLDSLASDEHQWLEIVNGSGKHFEVGMQSASYNHLGDKAEWRMRSGKPVALIVRYNIFGADLTKVASSKLVVSKIEAGSACVVGIVDQGSGQNEKARQMADKARTMPCQKGD